MEFHRSPLKDCPYHLERSGLRTNYGDPTKSKRLQIVTFSDGKKMEFRNQHSYIFYNGCYGLL